VVNSGLLTTKHTKHTNKEIAGMMKKLQNTIIYLIGIPAVGKYTIAKEIGRMTGARVIDNMVINTPVFIAAGYDGTDAFKMPASAEAQAVKIHKAVMTVVRDCTDKDDSFVFTNVLGVKVRGDKAWYRRVESAAKHRKAAFFPVWLTCEQDVIRKRKNTPDRRARLKDIDLSNVSRWSEEFEVLKMPHPNRLTLDTSNSEPGETARLILKHITDLDTAIGY
jgi:adenylylsulfate kinase-like enzyme